MHSTKNNILNRLPKHLQKFIVPQNYHLYTSIDHAVWRYIMRINFAFLSHHAHESYINGLKITGLSVEKIPDIDEMNQILSKIGWAAVCVDGFIPPAAFMEFQAYNTLVIAADIRNIQHITYTPAPDIVHEAAGHAPIIADPFYAEYLRFFGEIGCKAIPSKKDIELYEAIRKLSILKENPLTSSDEIKKAESEIIHIQDSIVELSEMAQIRNLHWWTVEYGLIGEVKNPKIYGAGLLSSIGESSSCLEENVRKIPYSVNAAKYSFDITTKQPQLFVTPDFNFLIEVLNEFADSMAFRTGGLHGIKKAVDSEIVCTCELSSGIQISGKFIHFIEDENHLPAYIQTNGPTILCEREQLLTAHGAEVHANGFGTVIGKLKNESVALENFNAANLKKYKLCNGNNVVLTFESGVNVAGKLHSIRRNRKGKILLISFVNCTVTYQNKILFQPEWGIYDMAVGEKITSVFAGPADKNEFDPDNYISPTPTIHNATNSGELIELYSIVRKIREKSENYELLKQIFFKCKHDFSEDWLLCMEIYEILSKISGVDISFKEDVKNYLTSKSNINKEMEKLIKDGFSLIDTH